MKRIILALAILAALTGPALAMTTEEHTNLLESNRKYKQAHQGAIVLWGVNQPQSDKDYWYADRLHKASQALNALCPSYRHPVRNTAFAEWYVETVNHPGRFRQIDVAGGAAWFTVFDMFGYWWRITYCETGDQS
jgi:hypothetical protein